MSHEKDLKNIEEAFHLEREQAIQKGDVRAWRDVSLIFADWLESEGVRDGAAAEAANIRKEVAEADVTIPPKLSSWPDAHALRGLTPHQCGQLAVATRRPLGVLCGSPGTGKTHVAATLAAALPAQHLAVCAPTGKAAVRIAEALRQVNPATTLGASTIHQLLGIDRAGYDGGGWGFEHGPDNPLPYRFVILDEPSMLPLDLAADLFRALRPGTHLLMVGDPDQLPPVGNGAPLRDLIASGVVPVGRLTEIHRNGGAIAAACAAIQEGRQDDVIGGTTNWPRRFDFGHAIYGAERNPENNWVHLEASLPEQAVEHLRVTLPQLHAGPDSDNRGLHPSIQILAPVRERGPLSCAAVNRLCQEVLNPDDPNDPREIKAWGTRIRPGDRVVCLHNHWAPDAINSNAQHYIANGETGVVESTGRPVIGVFGGNRVRMSRGGDDDDFALGYCLTGHKCVHPDTLVETERGLQRIRDLSGLGSGIVACPSGRMSRWTEFHENPIGPALRIVTADGYGITVTPDHKLEVWDGAAYVLREARNIGIGDGLRLRLGAAESSISITPDLPPAPAADIRAALWGIPSAVSLELAEFFGLMVADGTIFPKGFRLVKRHGEVVDRFASLCEQLFGVRPGRTLHGGVTPCAEVHSALLSDWLLSVGGMGPNEKAVPVCILQSPPIIQAAFLRGLFEDGTVHLNRRHQTPIADHVEWTTAYPLMAETVRVMLLRLGIIAATTPRRSSHCETILLYSESLRQFRDRVGFISAMKNDRLASDTHTLSRVRVPVADEEVRRLRPLFRQANRISDYQNALYRRSMTRRVASWLAEHPGVSESDRGVWLEKLNFHHAVVASVTETVAPSMCLTVPESGRFLQNGFAGSNSQGSEWPITIVLLDDWNGRGVMGREWIYTVLSRARTLCITIGRLWTVRRSVAEQRLEVRRTFLDTRIREGVGRG